MRFCIIFSAVWRYYFLNLQYCNFKILSSLQILQPLSRSFWWNKSVCGENKSLGPLKRLASSYFPSANQVFCFKTHQGSFYQLKSCGQQLSYCGSMYVQFWYSGKKSDAVCSFLAYLSAVLQFSDPTHAPHSQIVMRLH